MVSARLVQYKIIELGNVRWKSRTNAKLFKLVIFLTLSKIAKEKRIICTKKRKLKNIFKSYETQLVGTREK